MRIFRLEFPLNNKTYGFFSMASITKNDELFEVIKEHFDKTAHKPAFDEDGIKMGFIPYDYIFGCQKVDHFLKWMDFDMIEKLKSFGFFFSEYEVFPDRDCIGKTQVMWKRGEEEFIRHLTNDDIMEQWCLECE